MGRWSVFAESLFSGPGQVTARSGKTGGAPLLGAALATFREEADEGERRTHPPKRAGSARPHWDKRKAGGGERGRLGTEGTPLAAIGRHTRASRQRVDVAIGRCSGEAEEVSVSSRSRRSCGRAGVV